MWTFAGLETFSLQTKTSARKAQVKDHPTLSDTVSGRFVPTPPFPLPAKHNHIAHVSSALSSVSLCCLSHELVHAVVSDADNSCLLPELARQLKCQLARVTSPVPRPSQRIAKKLAHAIGQHQRVWIPAAQARRSPCPCELNVATTARRPDRRDRISVSTTRAAAAAAAAVAASVARSARLRRRSSPGGRCRCS